MSIPQISQSTNTYPMSSDVNYLNSPDTDKDLPTNEEEQDYQNRIVTLYKGKSGKCIRILDPKKYFCETELVKGNKYDGIYVSLKATTETLKAMDDETRRTAESFHQQVEIAQEYFCGKNFPLCNSTNPFEPTPTKICKETCITWFRSYKYCSDEKYFVPGPRFNGIWDNPQICSSKGNNHEPNSHLTVLGAAVVLFNSPQSKAKACLITLIAISMLIQVVSVVSIEN